MTGIATDWQAKHLLLKQRTAKPTARELAQGEDGSDSKRLHFDDEFEHNDGPSMFNALEIQDTIAILRPLSASLVRRAAKRALRRVTAT